MPRVRYTGKQIINRLRQAEVLLSVSEDPIRVPMSIPVPQLHVFDPKANHSLKFSGEMGCYLVRGSTKMLEWSTHEEDRGEDTEPAVPSQHGSANQGWHA